VDSKPSSQQLLQLKDREDSRQSKQEVDSQDKVDSKLLPGKDLHQQVDSASKETEYQGNIPPKYYS